MPVQFLDFREMRGSRKAAPFCLWNNAGTAGLDFEQHRLFLAGTGAAFPIKAGFAGTFAGCPRFTRSTSFEKYGCHYRQNRL